MYTIGFSATRWLTTSGESILRYHLTRLPPADRYVTGGCVGGDAFIGRFMAWKWPHAEHEVVIPANRSRVDPWWETYYSEANITLTEMPEGTTYKDRNQVVVDKSGLLPGFPAYPEEHPNSRRSGTWQTLRISKKAGIPVVWHTLCPPYEGDTSALENWRWGV